MIENESLKTFLGELLGKWYECAPYGEQIPEDLPKQFAAFVAAHHGKGEEAMFDAFTNSSPEDPMLVVFETIFTLGSTFAIARMADAVYDRNRDVLHHIDLVPLGTLATTENDPNPACKHQHIMHSSQGGRMLFAEVDKKP